MRELPIWTREFATYGGASLDKELADRRAVVHGIEGGDLVDTHGGHLEQAGDLVHDADAGESVLALANVKNGHDGGLFVLGRVALQDLGNDLFVLGAELERDIGVVVGRVAVLRDQLSAFFARPFCDSLRLPKSSCPRSK